MDAHRSRRVRRCALVALAASVAALATPAGAHAHARLLTTEPANDAVLETSPGQVRLRFSEPVETAFGAVRVYDAQARRVDAGEVERTRGNEVAVGLDDRLPRGTYTVTWRVVSADAHPVSGAFVFHVGAPGANPGGIAAQVEDGKGQPAVTWVFALVRGLGFALILLVAGGSVLLAFVLRDAPVVVRRRLAGWLAASATALALVALAAIVLQGAAAGGFGLLEALRWDVVSAVLDTRFGRVWLVQAGVALAVAALLVGAARRDLRLATFVPGLALVLLIAPSVSGHASVSGSVALVADVAHVGAAAVWAGGLAALVLALLWAGEQRWALAARAVPRFSLLAVGAVTLLVTAGVTNGYLQVRVWRGLWETTYGRLLLAKLALVLPLLALGAYNNRFAVPRLKAGIASAVERTRFLRVTGVELATMAAIVGVTAVLVAEPPARAQVAPEGPFAATSPLGDLELNLVVDPAAAGPNQIHLYLTDRAGRPADVAEATVAARLASKRIGPLRFEAHRLAPGHLTVHGAQLALAGDWQLRVEARRGEFEALTTTVSVPVRKER
jgi:copper transport protein